jgi:hypothetical protein
MQLNVISFTGENCITVEDGEQLYQKIHPEILKGNRVDIDFSGVKIFASPFFNAAIGQLLMDLQPEQLHAKLHFIGLSQHGDHVLRRVIENAKKYYTNPHFRESVEKVIAEQAHDL